MQTVTIAFHIGNKNLLILSLVQRVCAFVSYLTFVIECTVKGSKIHFSIHLIDALIDFFKESSSID